MRIPFQYRQSVKQRSFLIKVLGICVRAYKYCLYAIPRNIARARGAQIGHDSILAWSLAIRCNHNLVVGDDCIIQAKTIDNRAKIRIESHVIINKDVEVLRVSHYIDDTTCHKTKYFEPLIISSYTWIATGAKILPQVTLVSEGSVIGAYCVLSHNTEADGVYVGNPAQMIRKHNSRFTDLIVVSQMGGDLRYYINSVL